MMRARDIHAQIGNRWPDVLRQLGIPEENLQKRNGPCPACGGTDRYFFSNKFGHGDWFCRKCCPFVNGKQRGGDGFALLQMVHGWDFKTARQRVMGVAGLGSTVTSSTCTSPPSRTPGAESMGRSTAPSNTSPPSRVIRLRRETCALHDCDEAVDYLVSRSLWPAGADSTLRAHVGVDYFQDGQKVGRYPALIADIRDYDGELITVHTTYLDHGRKLASGEPRKMLSPLHSREACAVRLHPIAGDSMGIGEGLETCIAAAIIHKISVWSALNTTLLSKFTPPVDIKRLLVFADRDEAGLMAACKLLERLQGQVRVEIRTPPPPAKDWADVLEQRCR
jgi:putative DNA primase/helicase